MFWHRFRPIPSVETDFNSFSSAPSSPHVLLLVLYMWLLRASSQLGWQSGESGMVPAHEAGIPGYRRRRQQSKTLQTFACVGSSSYHVWLPVNL